MPIKALVAMKKDVMIYFAGKLIPAGVNLAIIILAVRLLGNAEYGKYSLVFNAAILLSTLTFGWIQQSILRFLSAYPGEQVLVINRLFFLTVASSVLAVITGLFLCLFYFHLSWSDTILVTAFIFLYNYFLFHLTLNQTNRRSLQYAIQEGTYYLIYFVVFLLLVFVFSMKLFNVLFMAMVIGLLATELIRITLLPGSEAGLDPTRIHFHAGFTNTTFSFGFPITIWLFMSTLLTISDRYILKEFTSYEAVGTYSAMKDFIIKIASFTTIPVLLAYHPMIVEKWNSNHKKEAMRLIRQGLSYCLLIGAIVFILMLLFSNVVFEHILHLKVNDEIVVTAVLTGSAFLWQAALLLHKPLELLLKPKLMLAAILAALTANTLANLLFVPIFGYAASAVASLGAVILYIILIFAFLFRFQSKGLLAS